jgi:phosphoribosyl 1,2-cyclic phosphodiesterase
MKLCVLASGSRGNCTFVASDGTAVLIDAGLSARETARRLEEIGARVEQVRGICVSHEHNDHTAGLRALHQRFHIPLFANAGTIEGLRRDPDLKDLPWNVFATGSPIEIGDLVVEPFSVPHDAYDPVGFVIRDAAARVGIVTDIGVSTTLVRERLRACRALVIEANHDEQLLKEAARPWSLKQRIMGRQGHLSNEGAAAMLAEIAGPQLVQVFLAHLSEDCNRHDLAMQAVRQRLDQSGGAHVRVVLSFPDRVSEVWAG